MLPVCNKTGSIAPMNFTTVIFRNLAIAVCASLVLSSCTTPPPAPRPQTPVVTAPEPVQQIETGEHLLQQALISDPETAANLRLEAADIMLSQGDFGSVITTLSLINPDQLLPGPRKHYAAIAASMALEQQQPHDAYLILNSVDVLSPAGRPSAELQLRLSVLRARTLEGIGSYLAAAQQRLLLASAFDHDEVAAQENASAIWHALLQVPNPSLKQYLGAQLSKDYRGWLELALLIKDAQRSYAQQQIALKEWRQRWPGHRAIQFLPDSPNESPTVVLPGATGQIALALPLTGNLALSGRAIRDGFMAAYYQSLGRAEPTPEVTIADTAKIENMEALYHGLSGSHDAVVGPLAKNRVRALTQIAELKTPTLALNYLADSALASDQLFQFGLSPRDEARQLVHYAQQQGYERAIIIAPDDSWGVPLLELMQSEWEAAGNHTIATIRLQKQSDYRNQLAQGLGIAASENRRRRLQQLLGKSMEFEPRRRQDIDVVLLAARPQAARAVKPLLAFHYAGKIPVLATSHVYSGSPDVERDNDLDGIRFVDIPWIAETDDMLKIQINQYAEVSDERYQRLFALGIDAFRLLPRLEYLRSSEGMLFGNTGSLKLGDDNKIERQGEWYEFRNGLAKLIPPDQPHAVTGDELVLQ